MNFETEDNRFYREAFLVKTNDFVELDYITYMLKEMDIDYRAQEEGVGQYVSIMPMESSAGICIYVDEGRLSEARELLAPPEADELLGEVQDGVQQHEQIDDEEIGYQEKVVWRMKRGIWRTVLIIAAIPVAIGILIAAVYYIYSIIAFLVQ